MLKSLKHIYNSLFPPHFEIVTDAPYRLEPEMPVPLVCMIKNTRKQPFKIESIKVEIKKDGHTVRVASALKRPVKVSSAKWQKVILIPLPEEMNGSFEIETIIRVKKNGKVRSIRNDSFRGGSCRPLNVFRAKDSLPSFNNYCFGDLHYHRFSTENIDSFSAPLVVSAEIAKALGLHFFATTDHSFVLDKENIVHPDSGDSTWERFKAEVDSWNKQNELVILPGEEVSCKNLRGRDVDLIIINYPEFIRGSGQSVEKKARPLSDYSLNELLARVGSAAVTFAVYPVKKSSLLDRWFFGKGLWSKFDLTLSGLTGLQVYNGQNEYFIDQGLRKWIELLLREKRKFIVAGSDAYANFNRTRKSRFPFFAKNYYPQQVFGKARTGIFCTRPITQEKIVSSLKRGVSVITDGPLMDFTVRNETGDRALLGSELSGSLFTIKFRAVSSPEYGPITKLKLYYGNISVGIEELIYTISFRDNRYSIRGEFNIEPRGKLGYLRGELLSGDDHNKRFCFTNPIWIRSVKG